MSQTPCRLIATTDAKSSKPQLSTKSIQGRARRRPRSWVPPVDLCLRPQTSWRCAIGFFGKPRNNDRAQQMLKAVHTVASDLAASWDLRDLDGITVADNLPAAVDAIAWHRNGVSRGAERFDRGERGIAGTVLSVKARYRTLEHIVLDAQFLKPLVDGTEMADFARNIIAHELAHVVFAPSRHDDECGYPAMDDWRTHVLLALARPLWNEYAACRLSALIGDYKTALFNFQNILASDLRVYPIRLRRTTRKDWHVPAAAPAFIKIVKAALRPLRTAAYLTGHLDGLGIAEEVTHFSTPARDSPLAHCFEPMRQALRTIWDDGRHWSEGRLAMDALLPTGEEAVRVWQLAVAEPPKRKVAGRPKGARHPHDGSLGRPAEASHTISLAAP